MITKSLAQIVKEQPFPEYAQWWEMGNQFLGFMSQAIISQWTKLHNHHGDLSQVQTYLTEYLGLVFNRKANPLLVENFQRQNFSQVIYSGEFDALSYAFYRSAFEHLGHQIPNDDLALARERRLFTKYVGQIFFKALSNHLQLNLPSNLKTVSQFTHLQQNIALIGEFLQRQGYLRDNFAFSFAVNVTHAGNQIQQDPVDFLSNLHQHGLGYALYEMGYPVILPSAVYLYHTLGEAQHHSSRTIEELFARVGYRACETDDFDPTGFPSDKIVELWEIRPHLSS